ncbi:MAG: FAD-dependent oxidoreductase, partial [Candidatus Limivicinus sp.]|nr:FAD-dependent oxidoreductase [Candidatus Limivicinus sp.]
MYDIIIIGGGPAGLTAATYARRAGKSVLVIEKNAFGGQITWSPKVENFPSVVSISGTELGDRFLEQAMEQGAEVELEEVVSVSAGEVKTVKCLSGVEFQARALIIDAGAKPRMLGLPREEELIG